MSALETREAILEAATRLFLQRGYEGVSIRDITEAVGLTKGALYHHFESKESLLSAVIGREFEVYRIEYARLPTATLRDFLEAALQEMERNLEPPPGTRPIGLRERPNHFRLIWDGMQVLEGFGRNVEQYGQRELAVWAQVVRAAVGRGELRIGLDPDLVAQLYLSCSSGVWAADMMLGRAKQIPQRIRIVWEGLYESLKT